MKAKRYNPCVPIRNSLLDAGYSTVLVMNAINSALGELEAKKSDSKLGDTRLTKTAFKVRETVTLDYQASTSNIALRFDAWSGIMEKANSIASFETVSIPGIFQQWLDKFAKADKSKLDEERAKHSAATVE